MLARAPSQKAFCRLLCASLLLSALVVVRAERLPIKIYTSADGLGSSAAFNLVRDYRGFIWLCSRDGLVRFDGVRFITYRIGSDDDDPAVYSILPTRQGVFWINLNRGTDYRFIDKGDATPLTAVSQQLSKSDQRVPLVNVEPIKNLRYPNFEDSNGNLWGWEPRGLDLLREVDGKTISTLIELQLPENPDNRLTLASYAQGSEGSFWVGTNWGLVRRLPDGRLIHYVFDSQQTSNRILKFVEDKENRVWIARDDGILVLKVNPVSQLNGLGPFTSRRVTIKPGSVTADGMAKLPAEAAEAFSFSFRDLLRRDLGKTPRAGSIVPRIYEFLCSNDGTIWITSLTGLISYDGKRFQHFTESQGLASNNVAEMVEDNDGNIWMGSYAGLMRLNPKGMTTFDSSDGLREPRVHSIYETSAGEMYFVTENWNISVLRDEEFKTARPQLPTDAIYMWHSNVALPDSHGDWWLSTAKGVLRYSGIKRIEDLEGRAPTAVYTDANGLIANETNSVFEDSRGDIWIGTDPIAKRGGVTRWERATGQFHQHLFGHDGLPANGYATGITEDRAGNLWFGFGEGGLRRYRDGHFSSMEPKEGSLPTAIMNLFTDSKGRLWIASGINGLVRIDDPTAEHPVLRRYTIADGLTSNNIRCITEDLFGNIYVGTVRGVNRISPDTGHIKYYGTGDGLPGDFVNAAHRDRNGAIWFGTFSGLAKLVPEPDVSTAPPPTLISRVRIAGIDYSISPLGQSEAIAPEQAANNNNLEIDFFSVSSGGTSGTRYQYQLEGGDGNWSRPTTQRSVTFANLSPGRYRFRVRSVNADEVASEKLATLTFRILPPLWQRWWFMTLAGLLIAAAVFALDRYRVARARELAGALKISQNLTEELTIKGDELSQAHRTLALDYDVTRVLAEAATPAEAAPKILAAICEATRWEIGALWYVDEAEHVLRCAEVWQQPEKVAAEFESLTRDSVFQLGQGLPGRVWQDGEPIWINYLEKDKNFPRLKVAAQDGLRSAFAFPILLGSEVIGVGEFFSHEVRQRDDKMLEMLAAIGSDIGQLIERKQNEEALRESEDRFRTLAETASDAIITIDESGHIVFVNPAVEKVFGYKPADLVGEDMTMLMPEYLRHLHRAGFMRYQQTGTKHISWEAVELPGLHRSGREIPLELSFGEFVRNERRYFTGIARDISERKQAAEALRKSRDERLRELERVRQRIATDLHDDIGSSLTQISIMSEVATQQLPDAQSPASRPLAMIANSARELVDSMSDIVWAINPAKDHLSDLTGRMRRFAADMFTSRNIDFSFRGPDASEDRQLGANVRREVFLIFKESVNNIAKHAESARVGIEIRFEPDKLVLELEDDGKGFDPALLSDGHGLMSMRDRARGLSGELTIESQGGRGTKTILVVPLNGS